MRVLMIWSSMALVLAVSVAAAETIDKEVEVVEEVVVVGVRERLTKTGMLKDVVEKTEEIGAEFIESTRSLSLTEAMQDSPGVIIANECSMCGYKRIQLNGLKAEHTTILTDGLHTHTMLGGFYAVDAIAMTGVDRIEVARGAGASLTAPEAIGGVINVITTERMENTLDLDISGGEEGFRQVGLAGTLADDAGRMRLTVTGQYDERDQFDADNNGVSEHPFLENMSLGARLSMDLSDRDNLVLRVNRAEQEVFGGPMLDELTPSISAAIASERFGEAPQLFVGDDVRNNYIGQPWETTEWIETTRDELSISWLRELNDRWNMRLSHSYSDHEQDSYYEGFDYEADNEMQFFEARFSFRVNDQHLLTFGSDARIEELRSDSEAGLSANSDGDPITNYVSDSFDYDVVGVYIQDSWIVNDQLEINAALRFDSIEADFVDPAKPGTEIDESIVSPRVDVRYAHTDQWTSRFSAGRGYRAPLSFFETDHGILDATLGFEIDIDELERSLSTSYTLSYVGDRLTASFAASHTEIDDLAALDETDTGVPILTQLDGDAGVTTLDVSLGYAVTPSLTVNLTAASYLHDDDFQSSFGVATTEEQLNLSVDWEVGGWEVFAALTWIGSRDLGDYGYEGFNDAGATLAKSLNAPSFYWLDARVARDFGNNWTVYVGGNNLLDATQAEDEDSPLFFDADGGYDVAYIYGLLRGRELYAGVRYSF